MQKLRLSQESSVSSVTAPEAVVGPNIHQF